MSTALSNKSTGFNLAPNNIDEAMGLANMICNSQLCPKNYQRKPEDTLVAMMMGNEIGLNPLQAIQNIAVINGRPSIYGDALMALVQNHPAFGGVNESFDESTMTATCTVHRKGGEKHTQRFSQTDAQAAGLWGKQGPWTQYPKRMLAMRARGFALRNQFADALAGLITREEAEDLPSERDITPAEPKQQLESKPPVYSEDSFEANFPKWEQLISSGRKSHQDVISMVSSKAQLTDEQVEQIKNIKQEQAA
jgi:hypothetical protein